MATGRKRVCPFPNDWHAEILGIAPDGRWLIGRDTRGGLHIVDAADGRERAAFLTEKTADRLTAWWHMATVPDAGGVVLIRNSDEIHLWDSATNRVRLVVHVGDGPGRATGLWGAVRSPDGRTLAALCGGRSATVIVWDTPTGQEFGRQQISRLLWDGPTFGPDGRYLAWLDCENDATSRRLYLWDTHAGERLEFDVPDDSSRPEFMDGGRRLLVFASNGKSCWQTSLASTGQWGAGEDNWSPVRYSQASRNPVLVPPGEHLIVAGPRADDDPCDTSDRSRSVVCELRDADEATHIQFTPDGSTVAALVVQRRTPAGPAMSVVEKVFQFCGGGPPAPRTFFLQMFDARSGVERACYTLRGERVQLLGFSPDGRTLWTEKHDAGSVTICGWDTVSAGPPVWLPATTGVGFLILIADWRRGRRRTAAAGGTP